MVVRGRRYFPLIAAAVALSPVGTSAQGPPAIASESRLTLSQVVEKLVQKNAERATALESYRGKRTYKIDYKGFPTALRAQVIVEMTYIAPAQKDFKIVSQSGSKWIVKRVLKRLIDAEKEAQEAANRASVELNTQNYNFTSLEQRTNAKKQKSRGVVDTNVLVAGISGFRKPYVRGKNPSADVLYEWAGRFCLACDGRHSG
jgi:hypothetical protein